MARPAPRRLRRTGWLLGAVPLALAACGSSPGPSAPAPGSATSSLQRAGATVLGHLSAYAATSAACKSAANPVVCVEAADRTLGGQVHTYANLLAVGKGFTAPQSDVVPARNDAQTLANSLEILGDAQPTQANYNQVLNNFDLHGAIAQLQASVQKLDGAGGG